MQTYEQIVATWLCFMCMAIRKDCNLSHGQFMEIARKYRVIYFLFDNYELLHYYDDAYVVEDVKRYIAEQGGKL
jgi:hypothetical protein